MVRKEHLNLEGQQKIISLRASLNRGLSVKLKKSFPNIIPVTRPEFLASKILDPN
jgi:hypothetical protein